MKFKIHLNNLALIKAFAINRKYIRKKKKRISKNKTNRVNDINYNNKNNYEYLYKKEEILRIKQLDKAKKDQQKTLREYNSQFNNNIKLIV